MLYEVCVICEKSFAFERNEPLTHEINGRTIVIENEWHMKCDGCGEIYYNDAQSKIAFTLLQTAFKEL